MPRAFSLSNSVCFVGVLGKFIVLWRRRTVMVVSVGASRARLCSIERPSSPAPRTRMEVMINEYEGNVLSQAIHDLNTVVVAVSTVLRKNVAFLMQENALTF